MSRNGHDRVLTRVSLSGFGLSTDHVARGDHGDHVTAGEWECGTPGNAGA